MILLITYDLKKPGQNYDAIEKVLKSAPTWWHYLDSTWIIQTSESVDVWSDKLRAVMDQNDYVLVVDISKQPRQGWLPQKAWNWINNNDV